MSAVARNREFDPASVELTDMRRRHLRGVLRIESMVYPRPWSGSLFLQEMSRRKDRVYLVARLSNKVIGYAGLMCGTPEAHVTTIAIEPGYQRRKIGQRLMLAIVQAAIDTGSTSMSLEVRKGSSGPQRMYEKFGFRPVGIRKGYYAETGEDAVVMFVDNIDGPVFASRLRALRDETELPQ